YFTLTGVSYERVSAPDKNSGEKQPNPGPQPEPHP
ncbi:MAG: histidinol phosphate phosphatase, partial [Prevotella melaninogenica]